VVRQQILALPYVGSNPTIPKKIISLLAFTLFKNNFITMKNFNNKKKPTSDHLLIYKPNETSFLSILQRISGGILSFLFMVVLAAFYVYRDLISFYHPGDDSLVFFFNYIYDVDRFVLALSDYSEHFVGLFIIYMVTFHLLNGIRIVYNDEQSSNTSLVAYSQTLKIQTLFSWLIIHISSFLTVTLYIFYIFP